MRRPRWRQRNAYPSEVTMSLVSSAETSDQPRRRRTRLLMVATSLLAAAILSGCGNADQSATSEAADPQTANPSENTGTTISTEPAAEAEAEAGTTIGSETANDEDADTGPETELFPDVLEATARQDSDGTWTFAVTLSSPYDSPDRYADAWRVLGPDGEEHGTRILAHDHAGEQPFTRSQSGIAIPADVDVVTVEGRDQVSGWGGATVTVTLER